MRPSSTKPIKVRWVGWWRGVDSPGSLFPVLLEAAAQRPVETVVGAGSADLEWWSDNLSTPANLDKGVHRVALRNGWRLPRWSSYWRGIERAASLPRLWWSGENVRPPVGFDLTLSSDVDSLLGTNAYFPYWWLQPGMFGEGRPPGQMYLSGKQVSRRPDKFCCAFFGKMDAQRSRLVHALRSIGDVDVYGRAVGRPVQSKEEIASRYAFVLCPENDLYPGYVTEKPFDAWLSGSVPLWWGSDPAGYLNAPSVVNLAECIDLRQFLDVVRHLWDDEEAWLEVARLPLLVRQPDVGPVVSAISGVLRP